MTLPWTDRLRGTLLGQAIGDALGLGAEFMTREEVRAHYPGGLRHYHQIIQDPHRRRWRPGNWTDDTEQMLCILDSLLERGEVDIHDIARRLHYWAISGGMGLGRTIKSVLFAPGFMANPIGAAHSVWVDGGRRMAANGGVMRTSVLGIWNHGGPDLVKQQAGLVCRITHADPRCVQSCELVCLVIAALLRGEEERGALDHALTLVGSPHPEILRLLDGLGSVGLTHLYLDEPESVGYTFKALGAGLWALLHASSFEQGLLDVINQGGDADSNGSVAGAILGARFGVASLPQEWIDGLTNGVELRMRVDHLTDLSDNTHCL